MGRDSGIIHTQTHTDTDTYIHTHTHTVAVLVAASTSADTHESPPTYTEVTQRFMHT